MGFLSASGILAIAGSLFTESGMAAQIHFISETLGRVRGDMLTAQLLSADKVISSSKTRISACILVDTSVQGQTPEQHQLDSMVLESVTCSSRWRLHRIR